MKKKPISNKEKQRMLKGVDKDRRDTYRGVRVNSRTLKPK